MTLTKQIAKHLHDIHFGGNWTCSNLKEQLENVTWQQATTKLHSCNTIVALVYHINYYVSAVLKVLQGEPLNAKDAYSFDHPVIQSQEDWVNFLSKIWCDAKDLAVSIEHLPDSELDEIFTDEKYGNYFRNLHGLIEHSHYHLGQIVIIKKILQSESPI